MFKTLTAGLMALTLTFTSATSAQAQGLSEEDVGKILFGLLATAAIANAVKNNRDDRAAPVQRHVTPRVEIHRQPTKPRGEWRHQNQTRHSERRQDYTVLPRTCLRTFDGRNGTQRMLVQRCLDRNYARAASLPDRCAVRVRTDRGTRHGYNPRCLRDMGYRISRR